MSTTTGGQVDSFLLWLFPNQSRYVRYVFLSLLIGIWGGLSITLGTPGYDLVNYYIPSLHWDQGFFYPYWVKWFLEPLDLLTFPTSYWVLMVLSTVSSLAVLRYSKGSPLLLLLGFPFIWNIWYGQLETISVIGLILIWNGFFKQDIYALNIGFILASFKPHITMPAALLIWLWLPTWDKRTKAVAGLLSLVFLSLIVFGMDWPIEWITTILQTPFSSSYNNASLFSELGISSWLLWLPTLLLPLSRQDRFQAVLATTLLTMPYVPVYSHLALYFWPMSLWQWLLGQLVWLSPVIPELAYPLCALFPLSILCKLFYASFNLSSKKQSLSL